MAKKGPLGVRGVRCTFFEMRFFEMRFFLLDSRRAGRVFKRFLGVVGSVLPEFGPGGMDFQEFQRFSGILKKTTQLAGPQNQHF